jgi:ubiquinol-cytochrome c reductase cytochrome b subunit
MTSPPRWKAFLEERTGLPSALGRAVDVAAPGGPRWRRVFGASLASLLLLEAVTGAAMMTVYSPTTTAAWSSTWYLEVVLPWGHLVRGLHHFGMHAIVVLLVLHLVQVVLDRASRRPRELNYLLGLALGGLVLFAAMTGFPLSWDQRGYWVSRIEVGIIASVPLLGPSLQRLLIGGAHFGQLTLTRFHTLHVWLVPLALLLGVRAHVAMVRRHGLKGDADRGDPQARWWPGQAARDAVAALVSVAVVTWLALKWGAPLDAPADSASHFPAVPTWFFSPLSQLLRYFPGRRQVIGTMIIPGALTTLLALLPWIDRSSSRSRRALVLLPLLLAGLGAVALGVQQRRGLATPAFRRSLREAQATAGRARRLARAGIPPEGPLEMLHNDPAVRPGELFVQHCGTCHAVRGVSRERKGPRLDGFGSREWATAFLVWPDHPELMGTTEIHDMQGQLRRLHDDGVRAVSEWLYSRGYEPGESAPDAALAAAGETIYRRRCTTCHQGEGDTSGSEAVDRDAPNLDAWGSRAYIRAQMLTPGARENYGERNHMPRFHDRMNERELTMVVDYMRSLRTRPAPAVMHEPVEAPAPAP